MHLMLMCNDSKEVWRMSPAKVEIPNEISRSFADWCGLKLEKCAISRDWEVLMMIIWKIWEK